ncbi:MAG: hypothetical protein GF364_15535 [Candidatus Lokiarchaeota archaeon]|nr:hypothetical protein [Candidatus Lokiarchaeota archaeon]
MGEFLRSIDAAIAAPEKAEEILEDHAFMSFLFKIFGIFSTVMWFLTGLDPKRSIALANENKLIDEYYYESLQQGSFWFSLIIICCGIAFYLLSAVIPSIILKKNTKNKTVRQISRGFLITISMRIPIFLAIGTIPMLIFDATLFNEQSTFIPSAIWVVMGSIALIELWRMTGKMATNLFLTFKKGVIIAIFTSITIGGVIAMLYFYGPF